MNFSLSLRTGTLISIGPGPHPRERGGGGSTFEPLLRGRKKKKDGKESRSRGRIATAQQEMLTANLICMQVQGEWRWWEEAGSYSLSNLHVKCWPGQLMGKRGIVCPPPPHPALLFPSPLHRHLPHFLQRAGGGKKKITIKIERRYFT